MLKITSRIVALLTTAALAGSAHAGLIGVKEIVVTKTANSSPYIQVSEFQAFETGTGDNVALASAGAVATAPTTWNSSSTPSKAIDGLFSDLSFPNMFHNLGNVPDEFLKITLDFAAELGSVTIYGRSDCCSERDIFDVSFFGVGGGLLYTQLGANATSLDTHSVTFALPNTAVPEPASIALFGLGLLGFAVARRKVASKTAA